MSSVGHFQSLVIAVSLAVSATAFSQSSDRCDDYLDRHYKGDLVPVALKFTKNENGEQTIFVTVKNIGTEAFTFYNPTGIAKYIKVAISAYSSNAFVRDNIPAGAEVEVEFYDVSFHLRPARAYDVKIDVDKQFGQHGCGVLGNDAQRLTAVQKVTWVLPPKFPDHINLKVFNP